MNIIEKAAKLRYIYLFMVSVLASLVLIALTTFLMFDSFSILLPSEAVKLSDQSLSGYIGIVVGGGVAFAGSFVAVMLADRALSQSDQQVILAENANRIAARQSPESELAMLASQDYARFKSMLLSVPALLRKAHRDNAFKEGGNWLILQKVSREVERGTRDLIQSNVPAMLADIADRVETKDHARARVVNGKRYFEFALSSLYYDLATVELEFGLDRSGSNVPESSRMVLLRLLHALYSVIREIDALIVVAHDNHKQSKMTELEIEFLERVLPVANLNRGVWLESDFQKLGAQILKNNNLTANHIDDCSFFSSEKDKNEFRRGGLILALHESGIADALAKVQASALRDKGQVLVPIFLEGLSWEKEVDSILEEQAPIFVISGDLDRRICELDSLIRDLKEKGSTRNWADAVVLLDQVEQFEATYIFRKHLNMNDAFEIWRFFSDLKTVLSHLNTELTLHGGSPLDQSARLDVIRGGLTLSIPLMKNHRHKVVGCHFSNPEKIDDINAMILAAADAADAESTKVREVAKVELNNWISLCKVILGLDWSAQDLDVRHVEKYFPVLDQDGAGLCSWKELVQTVDVLSCPPLLNRPLYKFTPVESTFVGSVSGDKIDLNLGGATVLGVAYFDSKFEIERNPLVDALASEGRIYRLF